MSIEVLATPYGPAATELLGERIAALKGGDPLAPVSVVVPTNVAAIGVRRALGRRVGSIVAVEFLKLLDVAERLAGPLRIAVGRRPVTAPVIGTAIRRVLDAETGIFAATARHPATEQALVRSYRELRDLSEEALEALAGQSRRAAEVVRICRRAQEVLAERWADEHDLVEVAVEVLRSEQGNTLADALGPVVIYLPQRITVAQGRLVSALAGATGVSVIAGFSGDARADSVVQESLGRLGAPAQDAPWEAVAFGDQVISAGDADEEVRAAVRRVVNAARDGVPLARIAILYGFPEPYAGLLHEHLRSAGIEFSGPGGRTSAGSFMGRGLLNLLDLAGRGFRRNDVFALLGAVAPGLQDRGVADVAAWERIARRAGVVRGVEQWGQRLGRFAAEQREAAERERADPEGYEWHAERRERDAQAAEELAEFMAALMSDLCPDEPPASWAGYCRWARALIDTYVGDERSRQDWPEVEQRGADGVLDVLHHLATLDEIDPHPTGAVFRSTVAQELAASPGRVGRLGQGVMIGWIGDTLGMDLDIVILLGLAEGVFPNQPLDDPLLPDREREAADGELLLRSDRPAEQHLDLLAALASAGTGVLAYPRADLYSAAERHPSRWLLESVGALAGRPMVAEELAALRADWLEFVPSFAGGIAGAAFPATEQEFRLQVLSGDGASPEGLRHHPLLADDPVLARGAEMSLGRAAYGFTRFDGNLSAVQSASPLAEVLSVSRLETWARCPLRYLLQHVLRVEPPEDVEQELEMSPAEKGSLVHRILEQFLEEELRAGRTPRPGHGWSADQRNRLLRIAEQQCEQAETLGLTGKASHWHHDRLRIMADLAGFLDEDNRRRADRRTTPVAAELSFGMPADELGPLPVTLEEGRRIHFRGRIDRVDRDESGGLVVVDYKTGRVTADHKRLPSTSGDPREEEDEVDFVQRGTLLQLPVYGLAARDWHAGGDVPVNVHYWFVSGADRSETRGYPLTAAAQGRFREVVGTIVEGIESGVFCDRPDPGDSRYGARCDYCNADRLGTDDRRREWERKRDDPALVGYRDLAEPAAEETGAE